MAAYTSLVIVRNNTPKLLSIMDTPVIIRFHLSCFNSVNTTFTIPVTMSETNDKVTAQLKLMNRYLLFLTENHIHSAGLIYFLPPQYKVIFRQIINHRLSPKNILILLSTNQCLDILFQTPILKFHNRTSCLFLTFTIQYNNSFIDAKHSCTQQNRTHNIRKPMDS